MTAEDHYQLVVFGAGPAGCAAAITAGRAGVRTALVTLDDAPPASFPAWLGPSATAILDTLGTSPATLQSVSAPSRYALRSWDLQRTVDVDDPDIAVSIADHAELVEKLGAAAAKADVACVRGTLAHIQQHERGVKLTLADDRVLVTDVLVIADGARSVAAPLCGVRTAAANEQRGQAATIRCAAGDAPEVWLMPGVDRAFQMGVGVCDGQAAQLTLISHAIDAPVEQQLATLADRCATAGLVGTPDHQSLRPLAGLAGGALDLDTHVGKHCLLVGDAGGFVCAFSGEGYFPALRSGIIAAEIVADALQADLLQDALQQFSRAWRHELATYLQMPNTDLSLLVPLIFNNQQMSKRMARAFFLGESF